jgi:HPt (histidine-containing phosphotransfer) domain-containing protein
MDKEPIYDMKAALQAFGDVSVVREALEVYLTEADGMLKSMRVALTEGNQPEIRRIVHWLRGGLSYLHAPRVRKACLELDERVSENQGVGAMEAFEALEQEMLELQKYVQQEGYGVSIGQTANS